MSTATGFDEYSNRLNCHFNRNVFIKAKDTRYKEDLSSVVRTSSLHIKLISL
uniref:Uncharacterized protein n=1 Tax=Arion vulgaris TaxID=1028688 RepID=A0A0B6ZEX0_9EUPU